MMNRARKESWANIVLAELVLVGVIAISELGTSAALRHLQRLLIANEEMT